MKIQLFFCISILQYVAFKCWNYICFRFITLFIYMEAENHIYRQLNFQTHVCINNPHWQSRWIIKCICKYYIVTLHILVGSFLEVLFLLLILISSELHEKPIRNKDRATEKSTSKNLWEEHHFFDCTPSFLLLSSSTPSLLPSDVLAEWPL